ncbi:hypothetical protein KIW84_051290 [Lathyrus oleraceus]|uniref:Aminotransferase-like plant mobile domain-containing protein n=1 Tax=Pisum sativum TaxID=3888 RepID=A0A9D5ADQ1_PEA|nr:hypothetical protein KIW84_051290 [Pisum sativum]
MITLTPFDITAIIGLRPIGDPFEPSTKPKISLGFNFIITAYRAFNEDYQALVAKQFAPLASKLHEGRKICLSRLILCGLYESLGLTSQDLNKRINPESLQVGVPIRLLQLWLNSIFEPSLKNRIPPNSEVGFEGLRLTQLTPDDGIPSNPKSSSPASQGINTTGTSQGRKKSKTSSVVGPSGKKKQLNKDVDPSSNEEAMSPQKEFEFDINDESL